MLEAIRKIKDFTKNKDIINRIIDSIVNFLINSEKNKDNIFDVFFEYNFMEQFLYLSNNCNCEDIILQIVKSFSLLIINIKNTRNLYFIFSNNFINNIISNPNILKYSDEFFAFYVNFLKSLALKLDQTSIQFFFHHNLNSFPLLESALRLYNHPDVMIRNVVRNVFLTICGLKYEPFYDYLFSLPSVTYFSFISCRLRDMIIKLNHIQDTEKFKNLHEEIEDDIGFISDIFSLNLPQIDYIITNCLLYYCIMPLVIKSIQSLSENNINVKLAVYIVIILFHLIKKESFNNILFGIIFFSKINKGIINFIKDTPIEAKGYYYNWENQKKQKMNSFQEYITINFSPNFLRSLRFVKNSLFTEVNDIVNKIDALADEQDNYNVNGEKFLSQITKDILSFFTNNELNNMTMYHKEISKATGVNCGLSTIDSQLCIMKKIRNLFEKFITGKQSNKLIDNNIKQNLLLFLKSKDDTLILLVNILINEILFNKAILINPRLYKAVGLTPCEMLSDDEIRETNGKYLNDKNFLLGNNNTNIEKRNVSFKYSEKENISNEGKTLQKDEVKMNKGYIEFEDFNSKYFDKLIIKKEIYKYDNEIISELINLISPNKPFRTVTIKLIIENITKLLIKETNKSLSVIVSPENKKQIENKYKDFVLELHNSINKSQSLKDKAFFVLYSQYIEYRKVLQLQKIIKGHEILLPNNITGTLKDYPDYLTKVKKSSQLQIFEYKIITFYLLHDLLWKLNNRPQSELFINHFPIKIDELELNQQYNILSIGGRLQKYECKTKASMPNNESYTNSVILILENRLYIGILASNPFYTKIKHKFFLNEIIVQSDRSEPRTINLIIINSKVKNDFLEFNLFFKDVESTTIAKRNIEENIRNVKPFENNLIGQYFISLINNLPK